MARGSTRDIVVIQCGRSLAHTLFAAELTELCARAPNCRLHLHASAEQGRLDSTALSALVPDWQQRETLLCGPDDFMQTIETMFEAAGRGSQLHSESFGRRAHPIDPDAQQHAVSYGSPEQLFTVLAGASLLDGAEQAGLKPRFGCRRGICHSCQCRKRSGSVRNLLTGQISGAGEELIQLCISTPVSALALDAQDTRTTP
jgi:ferredoxin